MSPRDHDYSIFVHSSGSRLFSRCKIHIFQRHGRSSNVQQEVFATPLQPAIRDEVGDVVPAEGMKWSGPIFPGDEPTEIWGSADVSFSILQVTEFSALTHGEQEVLTRILAINPDYAPEDSAEALGLIQDSGVSKRAPDILFARQEEYGCASMATGSTWDLNVSIITDMSFVDN